MLAALGFAVFAASALGGSNAGTGSFVVNGSITNADLVVNNPVYRASTLADCTSNVASQQTLAGNYHYKVYVFRNISQRAQCANISLTVTAGSASVSAYGHPFTPGNPSFGYIYDTGGLGGNQATGFGTYFGCNGCSPAAPHSFGDLTDVVVWETVQNGGANYTLLVEGTGIIMTGGGPTAVDGVRSFGASFGPKGVLVRWKTRSEHEALGFNVYRGDTKKLRLTRKLVRASGDRRGHTYSYLDRTARKGKAAPYYLEVVQRGGSKIMFGPALTAAG